MRLTNEIRKKIIAVTLEATFKERTAALNTESNELAALAYDGCYTKEQQDLMAKLPDGFFGQSSTVYIHETAFNLTSSRKVSAHDNYGYRKPNWAPTDSTILKRVKDHRTATDKLKSDRDTLRDTLRHLLDSITTDKQLRERWPDGEPFYTTALGVKPIVNPPAVKADTVNALIAACKERQ